MKILFVVIFLCLLPSCAIAPKPPECKGEFKPVNVLEKKNVTLNSANKIVRCDKGDSHGNKG